MKDMIVPIATVQQTTMDLTELCKTQDITHINDLGVIFVTRGCRIAEMTLSTMLTDEDAQKRYIAYCHLLRANHQLSDMSNMALQKFSELRENQELIDDAKHRLWLHLN